MLADASLVACWKKSCVLEEKRDLHRELRHLPFDSCIDGESVVDEWRGPDIKRVIVIIITPKPLIQSPEIKWQVWCHMPAELCGYKN